LEDLLLVAHGAHARGDLAERPLRVGGLGEVGLGPRQLVDEAGVRDGDGGLARSAATSPTSVSLKASRSFE
jgi:hypothetical protein